MYTIVRDGVLCMHDLSLESMTLTNTYDKYGSEYNIKYTFLGHFYYGIKKSDKHYM